MNKIEIIVFSHISGKVETIQCDSYKLYSNRSISCVNVFSDSNKIAVIPWNRVKQINILH
ncbi:hypothetical protein EXM98_06160 [Clostridium botulinum]|nr:hypothetical protein [Clostridium botulinum]NEZ98766.1 hypothetical protein [Clostridium botulinum]NFA31590.1 hypothetical protein [Clostridium botulinum]NFA86276.1 hypothetical protein [Clostridium botulinum]NFB04787.1 hypothetical protein [Clostridium botulinum]